MNDLLLSHQQRLSDRDLIQKGNKSLTHEHSQIHYIEKQRQRQRKQNLIISQLKKANKSFHLQELKKTFLSHTITIMNSYLKENHRIHNHYQKDDIHKKINGQNEKSQQKSEAKEDQPDVTEITNKITPLVINWEENRQDSSKKLQVLEELASQVIDQTENINFYQIYINLFVSFFNQKLSQAPESVNINTIKSIIRPNNRFVIVDLLKALLEFARHDIKALIKEITLCQRKTEKVYVVTKNTESVLRIQLNDIEEQESQDVIEFHTCKKFERRIQTEPEVHSPKIANQEFRNDMAKVIPINQFRKKNASTANFLKRNSTELLRVKTSETEEINARFIHANFIDLNIKQAMYQKNYEFVSQVNLQKLQSRINCIYIELSRLNTENGQIITNFYEQSLGKKNKFNYDPRGLYSDKEISFKKQMLMREIQSFEKRPCPTISSNSFELSQYAVDFTRFKTKREQFKTLDKPKSIKSSKAVSAWLPLRVQDSLSIMQPLRLQIQQINLVTGEVVAYPWQKYKKEYSITEFLKKKVKTEYEKILSKNQATDKNLDNELFKKKKFKKSLFVDNRKKMNELLLSNNVIFTKKQSIFPILKGIQENYMKHSSTLNTLINQQINYAFQNNPSKNKDVQTNLAQRKLNNLTIKASSNYSKSKEKRFDSIRKTMENKQRSERKYSESQKLLQRLQDKQKEKTELLDKLSFKYDLPIGVTNRTYHRQSEKYEKKNLISMSKIMEMRSQMQGGEGVSKTVEFQISPQKRTTILNQRDNFLRQ